MNAYIELAPSNNDFDTYEDAVAAISNLIATNESEIKTKITVERISISHDKYSPFKYSLRIGGTINLAEKEK